MSKIAKRLDGWINTLTGLGDSARDSLMSATYLRSARLSDETLEALYHDDDLAARICDALPKEGMRKGYELSLEETEDRELVTRAEEYETRLKFRKALVEAAIWARVYGGAVVYVGADDGQTPDKPLNLERVKRIVFVAAVDKRDINPVTWYPAGSSEKWLEPALYEIQPAAPGATAPATIRVHETRLLRLDGEVTSNRRRQENMGWYDSCLQRVYDALRQSNAGWQSTGHLLQEAAQGVFKIQGLIDMIASGEKEALQTRMQIVDMSKSSARSLLVDAESEDYRRESYTFAGVPEILDKLMLRVAAAARMPVSVLMGQSPAGLNATGESDTRLWYDQVEAYQNHTLLPAVKRFYEIMFAAQDFDGVAPDGWSIRFERLWQVSDVEQAALEASIAAKDKIYIDAGVLLAEEVALSRFTAEGFSLETNIDLEAREEMRDAEIEAMVEKAGEPDPVPPVAPSPGEAPADEPGEEDA